MATRRQVLKLGAAFTLARAGGLVCGAYADSSNLLGPGTAPRPGLTPAAQIPGIARDNWQQSFVPGVAADPPHTATPSATPPPPPPPPGSFVAPQVFFNGDRAGNRVYFTIDDCWSAPDVARALDAASAANVRLTFFPLGMEVAKRPDLWRRVAEAGHQIENHTYSHAYLSRISDEAVRDEIRAHTEAVRAAVGGSYTPRFLRPPGGEGVSTSRVPDLAASFGLKLAMWDCDSNGWRIAPRIDNDYVWANVFRTFTAGSVVVMHAVPPDTQALPALLAEAKRRGLVPSALSEGIC